VPADAWLLEAHELMLDESLLTGESVRWPSARVERCATGRPAAARRR
jgi:hypothetical protein